MTRLDSSPVGAIIPPQASLVGAAPTAPAVPAAAVPAVPPEQLAMLPRDPRTRLAALFDPGTLEFLPAEGGERSGAVAGVGLIQGTGAVAFASDGGHDVAGRHEGIARLAVAHLAVQPQGPCQRQVIDIGFIDLPQRAVALSGVVARVGGPGILERLQQLRGWQQGWQRRRRHRRGSEGERHQGDDARRSTLRCAAHFRLAR